MNQSYGGLSFVYVLSAGTACLGKFDFDFFGRNRHVHRLLEFRQNFDERKRGMAFLVRIERRNAHEPMDARFVFERAVRAVAFKFKRHVSVSAVVVFVFMNKTYSPFFPVGVFHIHFEKHSGEIFRVVSAGAGKNSDDGIAFFEFGRFGNFGFERGVLFENSLCAFLVVPKFRFGHRGFNLLYFLFLFVHKKSISLAEKK